MDSERAIEKLLRLAAKKRRQDAGENFVLHPATRRMLHGEVARQFGPEASAARRLWPALAVMWPKFAVAVGVLLALVAITWVVVPHGRPPGALALNRQSATPPGSSKESAPKPAAALADRAVDRLTREEAAEPPAKELAQRRASIPAQPQSAPGAGLASAPPVVTPSGDGGISTLPKREAAPARPASQDVAAATSAAAFGQQLASSETPLAALTVPAYGMTGGAAPAETPPARSLSTDAQNAEPKSALSGTSLSFADQARIAAEGSHKQVQSEAGTEQSLAGATDKLKTLPLVTLTNGKRVPPQAQQNFAQVAAKTGIDGQLARARLQAQASELGQSVLTSFAMQHAGYRLQVVDADGSVYTGSIQLPSPTLTKSAPAVTRARVDNPESLQKTPALGVPFQYSFRVTGTNRSLNEKVEFFGTLSPLSNAPAPAAPTNSTKQNRNTAPPLPLSRSQISGTVRVGAREEPVQAVPVP